MITRRALTLITACGAALVVIGGTMPWATGSVADAVLANTQVSATGANVAPAVVALALVAAAAVLGVLTAGRLGRTVALVVLSVAAAGVGLLVGSAALDPAAAVGRYAAGLAGRTGTLPATGSAGPGVLVAGVGALLLGLAGVVGWVGRATWAGLGTRYERLPDPADERGVARTAWDKLSDGHDPTTDPPGVAHDER